MTTAGEKHPMDRFKGDVTQVRGKVSDMAASVENELPTESGMTYLQVKNHALLTYTKMELFFALLKLEEPETVKDHPVFKELVRYRTLLERIRPLDRKMKYQVDKMLKVALSGGKGLDESLSYAPNPDQLAAEDEQDEDEEGEEGSSGAKDGIYRAPRLAAVPYEEEERAQVKQAKKDERNRKRLQKSTILAELREEFSERPAEILASGTSVVDKEIAREEAEKKDFEESRFVRVVTSRKDKIRKRQREMEASRADNVGSIDNFAAVQDILSLDKSKHRIPTPREPKKIGGKTGGIFSHVDAPTEKKRKVARSGGGGSGAVATSSTASGSTTSAPKKSSGKKKKVVFSNLFS
ncbi:Neuroguidin [Phytophthora ramorum]|uniref:Neuroguidin n=1 Tax=Phytophthora ramorum TaxID=164328 RepID=UPI0030B472A6|nr:Neuroguidin [Phytophthora ramorum]